MNRTVPEMNMMVSWPDDEHIQTSPYELTLGFHHVDTNTAGQRHAIVLRPSGDYVFGVIQEGTETSVTTKNLSN